MAKLADNCPITRGRSWGQNFVAIYRTTYEFVMPWNLGFSGRAERGEGQEERFRIWFYEEESDSDGVKHGVWKTGDCKAE